MPIDEPYREIAPPRALGAYVDRFWSRAGMADDGAHRVLPDGCVDLLVDLDARTAEMVGPMTRAALVPATGARIIAVRFRPGAGARFAGVPLAALADENVPAAELAIEARPLVDALAGDPDVRARVARLAAFVRTHLADADPVDRLVRRAVDRIASHPRVSIAALTRELGVSRQYLGRVFAQEVGVSPKALARIARLQRVMLAIRGGRRDWARLAEELGFADQAHLVHDATELAGASPTRLAGEVSISPIASVYGETEGSP